MAASTGEIENLAEESATPPPSGSAPWRARVSPRWVLAQLPVAVPPLVWAALGWHRRWITDDGLIAERTVRELLAGHGPVFNAGERVEANTSTLWTYLLALVSWVSRIGVDTAMIWTGVVLAPLGLLFALLGARRLHRRTSPGRLVLPVGALVVLALSPFWDFVTSGLEDSLVFFWLGVCWWLLTGLDRGSRRRAVAFAFAAGLGWLVRPDMAIGTVFLLAAGWYVVRPSWRRSAVLITAGGALPVAYQIFRMGYYGLLTPNTAVAKDASTLDVHQGLVYLSNFLTPYRLWMPVVLLVVLLPLAVGRRLSRTDLAMCAAAVVSGLVMAAYVVAIGGDFMHARMLLPATFAMLLPFMALPVPRIQAATLRLAVPAALCLLGVFAWALTCGASWRMTQKPAVVPANGIADERAFWVAKIHEKHPDAGEQYVLALEGYGDYTAHMLEAVVYYDEPDQPQLLYSVDGKQVEAVPLNRTAYTVGAPALVLGTAGSATPLDGLVVDQHGLSYGVGAHVEAQAGLRVGHNKYIDLAWIIAEYSDATSAPGIPQPDLAAARKALGCSALVRLQKASTAPLTFGQFWTNVFDSPSNTSLRFSNDPVQAERQLCR